MTTSNHRTADHSIDASFLDRWSPRAFTGEALPREALLTILEAGRWSPSAGNGQPWRFVYALNGTAEFAVLLDLLAEGNQVWAKKAGALIVLISNTHSLSTSTGERRAIYTHAFDTGAAWMAMAMQAMRLGYHAHGMGGIDRQRALSVLNIPAEDYRVEAAVAIGKIADKETLPEDLKAREIPSQRKPLLDLAFEGLFKG